MLHILVASIGEGLVSFLVVLVVLGGLIYILKALPIDETFKKVGVVIACILLFIMAIRILLPLAGL